MIQTHQPVTKRDNVVCVLGEIMADRGSIINIGSIMGLVGLGGWLWWRIYGDEAQGTSTQGKEPRT